MSASGVPTPRASLRNGTASKADTRTPMARPGASRRMPSTMRRRNVVRPAAPPYGPGPIPGAQQLVSEVAVTVLDVDEVEAGGARHDGGADEVADQGVELGVGEGADRRAGREAAIEDRVRVGRDRLPASARVRPRVAARVGELQADRPGRRCARWCGRAPRRGGSAARRDRLPRAGRAPAGSGWRGRRAAPRRPRRPRSTRRRCGRSCPSAGASDPTGARPACRPSPPSAGCRSGCAAPGRRPRVGCARGAPSPDAICSSKGSATPSSASRARNCGAVFRAATRG